jgi:hypothetical protein
MDRLQGQPGLSARSSEATWDLGSPSDWGQRVVRLAIIVIGLGSGVVMLVGQFHPWGFPAGR